MNVEVVVELVVLVVFDTLVVLLVEVLEPYPSKFMYPCLPFNPFHCVSLQAELHETFSKQVLLLQVLAILASCLRFGWLS